MAKNDFLEESAKNFEQKFVCVLLIDVSASMSDEALARVNEELGNLYRLIKEDETSSQRFELGVMTFGQEVYTLQEPALVEDFTMPKIIRGDGIIHAIDCAVEKINVRKRWYKETGQVFYRPCLVLVTDEAKEELLRREDMRRLNDDLQQKKYDLLIVGMNRSSVYAYSSGMKINLKETRSLVQMLFSVWSMVRWGDDACEMPLSDDTLTGLIEPPLEGLVYFEI